MIKLAAMLSNYVHEGQEWQARPLRKPTGRATMHLEKSKLKKHSCKTAQNTTQLQRFTVGSTVITVSLCSLCIELTANSLSIMSTCLPYNFVDDRESAMALVGSPYSQVPPENTAAAAVQEDDYCMITKSVEEEDERSAAETNILTDDEDSPSSLSAMDDESAAASPMRTSDGPTVPIAEDSNESIDMALDECFAHDDCEDEGGIAEVAAESSSDAFMIPDYSTANSCIWTSLGSSSQMQAAAKYGGLSNLGNTCYMASALQMIASCERFVQALKAEKPPMLSPTIKTSNECDSDDSPSSRHQTEDDDETAKLFKLRDEFLNVIERLSNGETVRPDAFKSAVDERSPLFLGYRQQDAHEFLTALLDLLDEDYRRTPDLGEEKRNGTVGEGVAAVDDGSGAPFSNKKQRVADPIEDPRSAAAAHLNNDSYNMIEDESSSMTTMSYSQLDVDAIGRLIHGNNSTGSAAMEESVLLPGDASTTSISLFTPSSPPVDRQYKLVGGRMNTADVLLTPYKTGDEEIDPSQSQTSTSALRRVEPEDTETVASDTNHQEPTPIDKNFTTTVRVRLTCDSCKYARCHKETFLHLSVEIGNDDSACGITNIEDGLRRFFMPCTQEVKCEKCFCETATQTMEITQLPPFLLLHLKRFIVDVSPDYTSVSYRKNQSPVIYDAELTLHDDDMGVLSEFMAVDCSVAKVNDRCCQNDRHVVYNLRSVVNHIGSSASCGHYTADAKRTEDPSWLRFNDSYVTSISQSNATEHSRQTAYLIMYELESRVKPLHEPHEERDRRTFIEL
jgi:ubiquitin C-terminal hydrolase